MNNEQVIIYRIENETLIKISMFTILTCALAYLIKKNI